MKHGTMLASLFILVLVLGICAASARASATFTVDSTVDEVDASPGDGQCATAGGVCTLRAAIQETNALAGADTINLPSGTYTLTLTGANEDAAATGDLDISDDLTIAGDGVASTIIDGNNSDRVFDVRLSGHTVSISGVTIQHGFVPSGQNGGGGVSNRQSMLTLTDVVVTNNVVTGTENDDIGGGISPGGFGGGTLVLVNSTISHNAACRGGGVFFNATLVVTNTLFYSNTAISGGGLNNWGAVSLANVTFSGNEGGGISNSGSGSIILVNCTIVENSRGIYSSAAITLTNTIVANDVNCSGSGTPTSAGHNLESADTCGFTATGDITDTNPLVGPLVDNGGATWTHALLPGSPAIDAGDNAVCPSTDQRGVPRPIDGNGDGTADCDIGAYERKASIYLPLVMRDAS